jgi:hypothetical protein
MKLGVTLDILNQKDTPAFYADTLANRPAAGFTGRVFISTDTLDLYRDTGSTWVLLSPSSTGTITGAGAAGQVTYFSGTSSITGDNNLFWDSVNGHLGIKTITPDCALDVNHAGTFVAKFNNTTTANTLIGIYNLDNPQWLIGSNSVANDLTFYDATNFPTLVATTTMKTDGTTFIGGQTIGSGRLNVYSATGDNGIQISGPTAPSLRIDNAPSGPTKRIGLGIATAVNNFIQGAVDRDMCIFNGSTTASPMLFGIYDTTNVQEAARISAARNFLIGTTTDGGQKLQVNGGARATGYYLDGMTAGSGALYWGSTTNRVTLANYNASGILEFEVNGGNSALTIEANKNAIFYGTAQIGYVDAINQSMVFSWAGASSYGSIQTYSSSILALNPSGNNVAIGRTNAFNKLTIKTGTGNNLDFFDTGSAFGLGMQAVNDTNTAYKSLDYYATKHSFLNGNLLVGTSVDAGQKLQVNGSGLFVNDITAKTGFINAGSNVSPVFEDWLSSNPGTNTFTKIQIGNSFQSSAGTWMKFIVNSNTANNSPVEIVTYKYDGSATFAGQVNIANTVSAAVAAPSTHKVSILINGVQYYLLASNV